MIYVCDAIMGSGKSQSAITYMNEHPEKRFIYITPYLDEASRIAESCPSLNFVEPSSDLKEFGSSKIGHTRHLISKGKNIASTHAAFRNYSSSMIKSIKEHGYTLIVDEDVNVLEPIGDYMEDLRIAIEAGFVEETERGYRRTDKPYNGKTNQQLFHYVETRDIIRSDFEASYTIYGWVIPEKMFSAFEDVFILTYLLEGQSMYHFLNIHGIKYEPIYIDYDGHTYRFSDKPSYIPAYVKNLDQMIDILDDEKMNSVGKRMNALSSSWLARGGEDTERLQKNLYNYFSNMNRNIPAKKKMWSTFSRVRPVLTGAGYSSCFVPVNTKATNEYSDRTCLAYAANIYMPVTDAIFYRGKGVDVDEDVYALSTLIQWIWRSAIRKGERVKLYLPSKRMRDILKRWIEETMEGGHDNA